VDYSFVFEAAGGTPPYTWSVALGNLPDGLTLTETGLLEGIPTVSGTFIFTIRLEDGACELRGTSYTVDVVMCEEIAT
jgi:Putative Ig domain.